MKAIYPGTFDPFTLGHLDIAARAAKIFEKVYVAVAADTGKTAASLSVRKKLAELSLQGIKNIEIIEYRGITTDLATVLGCGVIVRGIRNILDAEYEKNLAAVYKSLVDIEVITLFCQNTAHISSSTVRELIKSGADETQLNKFVAPKIANEVINIYR